MRRKQQAASERLDNSSAQDRAGPALDRTLLQRRRSRRGFVTAASGRRRCEAEARTPAVVPAETLPDSCEQKSRLWTSVLSIVTRHAWTCVRRPSDSRCRACWRTHRHRRVDPTRCGLRRDRFGPDLSVSNPGGCRTDRWSHRLYYTQMRVFEPDGPGFVHHFRPRDPAVRPGLHERPSAASSGWLQARCG
jgi:hypothetical protein